MNSRNQPPPQAVADLPVFQTLLAAFPATYGNPALLLRAMAGGLILIGASGILFLIFPNPLTLLLLGFVGPLAASTHFGVNWYRVMLLGPAGLVRPTLKWDRRHWRVFGYAFAINVATAVVQLSLTVALPFLSSVIALAVFYVTARLSFIFPALSVEEDYSLQLSWQHTKGQGLRLTTALLLAGLPLYFVAMFVFNQLFAMLIGVPLLTIAELAPQDPEALQRLVGDVAPFAMVAVMMIFTVMVLAVLAVEFTIVALAFRTCTGWVPAAPGQIAAVFGEEPRDDDEDGPGEGGDNEGDGDKGGGTRP